MSPLPTNDDLKYGQGFRGIDTSGGKTLPVCVGHGADLVGHIPRDSKLMMQDSSRTLDGYTPAMRGRSIACHVVWLTNRHGDPRAYKLLTFLLEIWCVILTVPWCRNGSAVGIYWPLCVLWYLAVWSQVCGYYSRQRRLEGLARSSSEEVRQRILNINMHTK